MGDFLEPDLHLGPPGRLGGGGEPSQQQPGQRRGSRLRQGAAIEQDLLARIPHRGAEVLPVQRHDAPSARRGS
jgi:hypothetical protein